jgi:hypothetical protein
MAKELGYCDEKGKGKQSLLSQSENNPKGPPLEFVEKYANFFKLDSAGKFDLFHAALESSKEIKIDITALRPVTKKTFFKFVTAMILCKGICNSMLAGAEVPFPYNNPELENGWKGLMNAVDAFVNTVKQHSLAYRPDSKTADGLANIHLESP